MGMTATLKSFLLAALGLAVAAGLCIAVASATNEANLMSSVSPNAGLSLAPGNAGAAPLRKATDRPDVVVVSNGKAVQQSRGSVPLITSGGASGANYTRVSRNEDD